MDREIPPPEILERQKDGVQTLIPDERVSADPDDDYLYYLALDTMADYLVSGDSHLLQISSDRVSILSPRRFWEDVMVPRL